MYAQFSQKCLRPVLFAIIRNLIWLGIPANSRLIGDLGNLFKDQIGKRSNDSICSFVDTHLRDIIHPANINCVRLVRYLFGRPIRVAIAYNGINSPPFCRKCKLDELLH